MNINITEVINSLKEKLIEYENHSEENSEIKYNKGYITVWLFKSAVLKIKEMKSKTRIEIAKQYLEYFSLSSEEVKYTKSEPNWGKIVLNKKVLDKVLSNINEVYEQCYLEENAETFGCCSRYMECSNNKKCIHPDLKFAKGCKYKKHLETGKIFYGKNRNI